MIARQYSLPLLIVCENNGWQDHTPSRMVMPMEPARMLAGLGLPTVEADGNDVTAVAAAAGPALAACRAGDGPRCLVAHTYLRHFHSQLGGAVPQEYRPDEEVTGWLERDPVTVAAAHLRGASIDPQPLREAATRAVRRALKAALAAPGPPPETAASAVTVATWPVPPTLDGAVR